MTKVEAQNQSLGKPAPFQLESSGLSSEFPAPFQHSIVRTPTRPLGGCLEAEIVDDLSPSCLRCGRTSNNSIFGLPINAIKAVLWNSLLCNQSARQKQLSPTHTYLHGGSLEVEVVCSKLDSDEQIVLLGEADGLRIQEAEVLHLRERLRLGHVVEIDRVELKSRSKGGGTGRIWRCPSGRKCCPASYSTQGPSFLPLHDACSE